MIAADASLVDRDPELAGLSLLLDPARLGEWFAQHGSVPGPLEVTYLRYKPGTSITAGITTPDGPAFGYAVTPVAAPKLDKLLRRAPRGSVLAYDPQRRVALARPVADRDLPGVHRSAVSGAHVLAYKPQRRWVAMQPDGRSIVRCYRRADVVAAHRRWPVTGPVRVPQIRRYDARRGAMVLERLPGRRLDRTDERGGREPWRRAGMMLATWHRDAPVATTRALLPDPSAVAEQIAILLPDRAAQVTRLAARLQGALAPVDVGWCHGDFAADQVLVDEHDEPALLDWDRSGLAPRALDLASADAAAFGADPDAGARRWDALLDGYQEVRRVPAGLDSVRAWSHLVRAAEPFRQAQPYWDHAIRVRLNRIEELL